MPGMTLQEFVASLPSEHEEFCVLTTDEILEWAARERMLEKAVEVAVTYHADGMIAKAEEERLPVLVDRKQLIALGVKGMCSRMSKPCRQYNLFRDGNMWCATRPDFINLQESPAGFGTTPRDALAALIEDEQEERRDGLTSTA